MLDAITSLVKVKELEIAHSHNATQFLGVDERIELLEE
jgi:hypothetical protein